MPDHPFEQLGPERFQEFSQALLSTEYRDLQCLPVAQPDGGRDALVPSDDERDLLIFQVKFARKPERLTDPEGWVNSVLEGERKKIERLKERGATKYVLVTNLSSTSHLDTGSLDKVQGVLEGLPLPAQCWWRDDLNRRLEREFDLKLSYPDLFTGTDFLRILIEREGETEEGKRRRRALRGYLAEQYSREREVRFKQAELESGDLLAVFIDVPAAPVEQPDCDEPDRDSPSGAVEPAGAGTLLLSEELAAEIPCAVLEGAPGQGKSTVLQYVCQVHRMRLLDKEELSRIKAEHAASPVRLPFRVDLRELAQWLRGEDPYEEDESEVPPRLRTLEGFLSRHVTHCSGGAEFSVADVQAAVEESHVLLALDGLDEVAGSDDRTAVVEGIKKGVERLEAVASSMLAVVTSRPASFVGTVTLPKKQFPVVQLQSLTPDLITEYAGKWMQARELEDRERAELTRTLNEKLGEEHIGDLARNPMQLAILLNLIHRRGEALPDKRTALYSSYMEKFLDREAGKSRAVKKNREQLELLHGHIAWLLHCRAERSADSGRFTTEEIEQITSDFLESNGYERDLFGEIFEGAFDRVGALVSRVQDTYEFEVQPLREFFAGQYLYQTAPYQSAGDEKAGTRPERLDAIARHPFWLNVTRFYAGSYDVGEISSLAERLEEMHSAEPWTMTHRPRMVAARLLADWAFQQNRKVQDRVVNLLEEDLRTRGSLSQRHDIYGWGSDLVVPAECGGDQIVAAAAAQLRTEVRGDRRGAMASLIKSQLTDHRKRVALWREELGKLTGAQRDRWIRTAYNLDLHVEDLAADLEPLHVASDETLNAILYAEQFAPFDRNEALRQRAVELILSRPTIAQAIRETHHPLAALAGALHLDRAVTGPLTDRTVRRIDHALGKHPGGYASVLPLLECAAEALAQYVDLTQKFGPWENLVETGRSSFGEHDALTDLAIVVAGIPDRSVRSGEHDDLFDRAAPLCQRTRQARLRSDDPAWWAATLKAITTEDERVMCLALGFLWADAAVFAECGRAVTEQLDELDDRARERLVQVVGRARALTTVDAKQLRWSPPEDSRSGGLAFALLRSRIPEREAGEIYERHRWFVRDSDVEGVLNVSVAKEIAAAKNAPERWAEIVASTRRHYEAGMWQGDMFTFAYEENGRTMPFELARAVTEDAENMPLALVALAESRCLSEAQKNLKSVAEIADEDGWFAPEPAAV